MLGEDEAQFNNTTVQYRAVPYIIVLRGLTWLFYRTATASVSIIPSFYHIIRLNVLLLLWEETIDPVQHCVQLGLTLPGN